VNVASLVLDAQDPERLLRAAMNLEMVDGNPQEAIAQYPGGGSLGQSRTCRGATRRCADRRRPGPAAPHA
jgi:hypothetical protein